MRAAPSTGRQVAKTQNRKKVRQTTALNQQSETAAFIHTAWRMLIAVVSSRSKLRRAQFCQQTVQFVQVTGQCCRVPGRLLSTIGLSRHHRRAGLRGTFLDAGVEMAERRV